MTDILQMAPEVLYRVIYGQSTISSVHPSFKAATLLTLTPAILNDYCRYKVRGADYPGIVSSAGHSVRGTFVTGLTDSDIHRLNGFEGSDYTREKVMVSLLENDGNEPVGEMKMLEAETYVFKYRDELEDSEWDYDTFRKEKMHRWADHSEEYAGEYTVMY